MTCISALAAKPAGRSVAPAPHAGSPPDRARLRRTTLLSLVMAISGAGGSSAWAHSQTLDGAFNQAGNILISDQYNNRVVEIDRAGQIVFQFGSNNPSLCNPGPGAVIAPNDVERLAHGQTLIAGTGSALSSFPCPDNRVFIINRNGAIVFQYGQAGVTGSGPNELNTPVFAIEDQHQNVLITDQGNNRILLVDQNKNVLFTYGPTSGPGALNNPNSAEILGNGDILIADENNSRVLEINRKGQIVSQIKGVIGGEALNTVAFASRLPSGDTLITDSGNNRVIQVTPAGQVVFSYQTNLQPGSNPNPNPSNAVRLVSGATLITDQLNDRVIIVDPSGHVQFQYGMLNMPGNEAGQLNGPYNAVVIGQYLGVTKPPGVK